MPDGGAATIDEFEAEASGSGASRLFVFARWLVATRTGRLWVWIVCASLAIVGATLSHFMYAPLFSARIADSSIALAFGSIVLPALLLLLASGDNVSAGPRLALPLSSLCILIALAALSVASHTGLLPLFQGAPRAGTVSLNRVSFYAYLLIAFVPLVWNAAIFARHHWEWSTETGNGAKKQSTEDEDAEAMGALVATLIVLAIGTLAVLAGNGGDQLSFKNSLGLLLCGAVISVFAIVVFLDVLAESAPVRMASHILRQVSKRMRWIAAFYNFVDAGLVRIGAGVAGMEHRRAVSRYAILAGILLSLSVMGWCLPPPMGLLPILIGFILAISVSRLWSWVEEDRALAAMTDFSASAPYRIGFREDYRDETLLGFIFVFALVPIAMMQAHEGRVFADQLFSNAEERTFFEWFGYFGVELAKAIPIVDWAEIYGVQQDGDMIGLSGVASKHSVFLARVTVDLVLIAALLQAIGIANRNRQQKRLYNAGHISRLDPFVERIEMAKAIRYTRMRGSSAYKADLTSAEAAILFNIGRPKRSEFIDFRKYDRNRLKSIGSETSDPKIRAFIAALAYEGGWSLSPAIDRAKDIAASPRKNELELFKAFQRSVEEHDNNLHLMDADDMYVLLTELRLTSGLKDFKQELIDRLINLASPQKALDHLIGVAMDPKSDNYKYTRDYASKKIRSFVGKVSNRELIIDAISRSERARQEGRGPSKAEMDKLLRGLKEMQEQLGSPGFGM